MPTADELLDTVQPTRRSADDLLDSVRPRTADEMLDDSLAKTRQADANFESNYIDVSNLIGNRAPQTRNDRRISLADQAAAVRAEPAPSVYGTSIATATKLPGATGGNIFGSLMKGLNAVLFPNWGDPEGGGDLMPPQMAREQQQQLPLYKVGDWFQGKAQDILDSVPEQERNSVAAEMNQMVSGLAPIAAGAGAPALFGLLRTGEVYDSAYQDALDNQKSPNEAASIAANRALVSGVKEAATWEIGPKVIHNFVGERILRTAGTDAASRWLAQSGAQGITVGGTSAANQALQNVIEGKPIGDRVGEEFVSGFLLPTILNPTGKAPAGNSEVPFAREIHDVLDRFSVRVPPKPAAAPSPYRRPGAGPATYPTAGEPTPPPIPPPAPAPLPTPLLPPTLGPTPQQPDETLTPLGPHEQIGGPAAVAPLGDNLEKGGVIPNGQEEKRQEVLNQPPASEAPAPGSLPKPTADELLDSVEQQKGQTTAPGPRFVVKTTGQANEVVDTTTGETVDATLPGGYQRAVDIAKKLNESEPPTNEQPTGQPPTDPPRVDVREPTATDPGTTPSEQTAPPLGPEIPTSAADGGSTQTGTGTKRGPSVPSGTGNRPRPGGRTSDGGQPPGSDPVTGTAADLPTTGSILDQLKAKLKAQEDAGGPVDDRLLEQIRQAEAATTAPKPKFQTEAEKADEWRLQSAANRLEIARKAQLAREKELEHADQTDPAVVEMLDAAAQGVTDAQAHYDEVKRQVEAKPPRVPKTKPQPAPPAKVDTAEEILTRLKRGYYDAPDGSTWKIMQDAPDTFHVEKTAAGKRTRESDNFPTFEEAQAQALKLLTENAPDTADKQTMRKLIEKAIAKKESFAATNAEEVGITLPPGYQEHTDSTGARTWEPIPEAAAAPTENDLNHVLPTEADWIPTGDKSKVRANLDAIKLLKQLETENRNPTPAEKAILAKFTGWGGLQEIFDEGKAAYRKRAPWQADQIREAANWEKNWGQLYDEVHNRLTPEELAAARKSIRNAHYTSREVIQGVWKGVERLGFKGGRAIEPSEGIGHFIGLTPEAVRGKTKWTGVELDSISARISAKLYPEARTHQMGFQDAKIAPNSQDLVISNFPFAADGPIDKRYPSLSLHNYFFARALDVVKPGGLVAAITSDSTMDNARSQAARNYFAEKADLVGAIRLPNNAFAKNAGTEVTTDILFFRKRDGMPFKGEPFTQVLPSKTVKGEAINLNEYFVAHPDMMLGRMSREGTQYGPDQQALIALPGASLSQQIAEAVAKLPENVMGSAPAVAPSTPDSPLAEKSAKVGQLRIKDGAAYQVQSDGSMLKTDWSDDRKKVAQAFNYITLVDSSKAQIARMLDPNITETEIVNGRKDLNLVYDAYFKKHGRINERRSSFLDDDVDFPLALALEDGTTKLVVVGGKDRRETVWSKSKIFSERTLYPRLAPEHADTVNDGLQISQNFQGKVVPDYIAKLTGKDVEAVKAELESSGQAFENPDNGQWENRSTYLSGFVKVKLRAAEAAAEADPRYNRYVAELKKILPPPIAIEKIGVKLGSVFVPPSVIENFLRVHVGVDAKVNFTPQTGDWSVQAKSGAGTERNRTILGIHGWGGHDLVESALNLRSPVVTKTVAKEGGGTSEVKDPKATLEAAQKQSELQDAFKEYLRNSPDTGRLLETIYNEKYNGVVTPRFDAPTWSHYPGAATDKTLREHQKAVVTRMLQNSTILAHAVGTGKTFAMVTAAMEMRRLGLAKKPMIVVQNATLEQFARSFKQLYPTSRLLAPNRNQRDAQNRQKTMARIATGDWDAVIVPQSFIELTKDDPIRETKYINEQVAELEAAKIEAAFEQGKKSPKAKDLQKAIDKLKEQLDELSTRPVDNVLTFEQTGVDALFVDEAHAYKKRQFTTKMDNIKGLDKSFSKRGWSMAMKTRWIQEQNQGRNVIFATGTPVSNTIAEVWNMMRYVRPDVLKAYNIEKFDDFASTFGETVTKLEPTGTGDWKPVSRFARFANGPELIAAWRTVADVVTSEEVTSLDLPALKNGKPTPVNVKQTPDITNYIAYLRSELARFAAMSGRDRRTFSYIPLVVQTLARKAMADMRMIDPSMPDQPGSKLNKVAANVLQIWRDSTSVKGAQMVFADLYQDDPKKPSFNLYLELKRKLIEGGIPEGEVLVVDEKIKDAKRDAVFTKLNAGDIRVAIGGTERMGVGVNAQEHLLAVHHVAPPRRPMDIEQRNGRMVRQGNQNPEVEIFNYGVEASLDSSMYDLLATKQRFINQIMRGDVQGRNFEDAADEASLSFEDAMAAFSGDPRVRQKVGLESEVRQLQMMRNGHFEQMQKARTSISDLQSRAIPYAEKQVLETEQRAVRFAAAFAPDKEFTAKSWNKTATGRKEVAALLDERFKQDIAKTVEIARRNNRFGVFQESLGAITLNDQNIHLTGLSEADAKGIVRPDAIKIGWQFEDGGAGGQSTTGTGFYTSLAAVLERIAAAPKQAASDLLAQQRNLKELSGFLTQPFAREADLSASKAKLNALTAELEAEGKLAAIDYPVGTEIDWHVGTGNEAEIVHGRVTAVNGDQITIAPGGYWQKRFGESVTVPKGQLRKTGENGPLSPPSDENKVDPSASGEDDSGDNTNEMTAGAPKDPSQNPIAKAFEKMRSAADLAEADTDPSAGEVEHGFSGSTTLVQAAVKDFSRLRNLVAPQTAGETARYAGNLLREFNAKMANELARADVALRKFRRDFDRTPVNTRKFKYDPTLPLPRNFAFIDAYENGNVSALSPTDQMAATELHNLNQADLARVHALGTGALTTFYANYFPHIWDNPKLAASVFGKILGHAPLEGPKGFLKQRTHQLFTAGLAAGLKPVHDNPIDLWLLKKREIERFIMGKSFVQDMRGAGLAPFKYVFAKMPDGYAAINDSAFTVYGPPTVTIKEAFDAGMREATLQLLQDLGVPHERLARIGGQRWGYERERTGVPGSESIVTKFAGPDEVIWHELGHVLHNRYKDLQPTLTATDALQSELRALADERLGASPTTSFRRNVRSMPEKMAVVLQAYVHAPDLMQRVAPTVKLAFTNFLKAHPELAPVNDIRPTLRLGVGETGITHGGLLKLGDYIMPEAAARVVNNFLSPGLNPHLWYRTLRQTSNLLNGVQLGLSAFHLGFTSLDAATSRLAIAMEDAAAGKVGTALRTAATVPIAPFTNIRTGAKLRAEVLRPGTHPEMAALARALEHAGGRVGLDAFWQTEFTRRFQRAWHEGGLQWATLPIRLPLAAWEQTMRPILEYIVPRQKLGVFADMAKRDLLALGPTADAATTRETLRKSWDSVDNRMGQVVYDNLFYNRSVKDVALLSFRAYGWQLGKYREGLGAVADSLVAAGQVARLRPPDFTHRMAYALALPILVGGIGGLIHYLMTGRKPDEAKDYFMPKTGELDRAGNPVRLNLPSYVKDAIAYSKHPLTALQHSLNPLIAGMMDLLQNHDFYNVEIRNPDDPLWQQGSDVAQFAAKQFTPFSVSGAAKLKEDAAPAWKQVAPFFGVTPVPQRLTMTPAQELASEIMSATMPSAPRTKEQFDRSKLLKEIIAGIKSGGDAPEWVASLAGGLDAQLLAPNTVEIMLQRLKYNPLQFQVSHFTPEAAMRVWVLANAQEQEDLAPIIAAKIARAKTLWTPEKAALLEKMMQGTVRPK